MEDNEFWCKIWKYIMCAFVAVVLGSVVSYQCYVIAMAKAGFAETEGKIPGTYHWEKAK